MILRKIKIKMLRFYLGFKTDLLLLSFLFLRRDTKSVISKIKANKISAASPMVYKLVDGVVQIAVSVIALFIVTD